MGEVQIFFSKNSLKNTSQVLSIYPDFIRLLKAKKPRQIIPIKAKDLCTLLDICDNYSLTRMGRLLRLLEKHGLAVRWNSSRPAKYALHDPIFLRIREICGLGEKGEEYCVETGCSLLGICPYWVVKNGGKTSRGEAVAEDG
ncbi:MAG: hypothetical protein QXP68_07240 [Thermosphaera sp.]